MPLRMHQAPIIGCVWFCAAEVEQHKVHCSVTSPTHLAENSSGNTCICREEINAFCIFANKEKNIYRKLHSEQIIPLPSYQDSFETEHTSIYLSTSWPPRPTHCKIVQNAAVMICMTLQMTGSHVSQTHTSRHTRPLTFHWETVIKPLHCGCLKTAWSDCCLDRHVFICQSSLLPLLPQSHDSSLSFELSYA